MTTKRNSLEAKMKSCSMNLLRKVQFLTVALCSLQSLHVAEASVPKCKEESGCDDGRRFWETLDQETLQDTTPSLEWMLDVDESFPSSPGLPADFRASSPKDDVASDGSKRSLRQPEKKNNTDNFHWPASTNEKHRLLIRCKKEESQEECVSSLLRNKLNQHNHIKVIHNMPSIHALSVEVDSQTRDGLFHEDFELHLDFKRKPMVMEQSTESISRNLKRKQEEPWGMQAVRAKQVWNDFRVRGERVKVCVLDTGIDASHEDFGGVAMAGYMGHEAVSPWNDDGRGHGTHITGIVAASDNKIGIVGIAPKVELFIVKVFDDERNFHSFADGTVFSTDLIAAAQICKEAGADVISASLGGFNYNQFEDEYFRKLYEDDNILTIAAAGNAGDERNVYPAAYDSVLSVAAADKDLRVASFASISSSSTDVLAPGVEILSTYKDNEYRSFSGSSMAAPHATGIVALLLSYIQTSNSNVPIQRIYSILRSTANTNGNPTADRGEQFGHIGVIDAYAAVEAIANGMERLDSSVSEARCASEVRLELSTDDKGYETAYRLQRMSDGVSIWLEAPNTLENNAQYSKTTCLEVADACYRFEIRDMGSDGIKGPGVKLYFKGHELYHGGNFGRGGMMRFGSC